MELMELLKRCVRIIHISRKPTSEEYQEVAKVAGIGILLFGTVGLIIPMIMSVVALLITTIMSYVR